MKEIYILFLIFYVYQVICLSIKPVEIENTAVVRPAAQMDAVVYKTINKYYCSAGNMSGINTVMYGTNAWQFPKQNVNLTLRYPTTNANSDYMITGFQVVLYIDSIGSNGFITDGGILRNTITLTFTSSQISTMRYQFWVYGIQKDRTNVSELHSSLFKMCY